jgi:hypothetical protein
MRMIDRKMIALKVAIVYTTTKHVTQTHMATSLTSLFIASHFFLQPWPEMFAGRLKTGEYWSVLRGPI